MGKLYDFHGKHRKTALISSALLLCSTCMIGQTLQIKGKVIDEMGEPLLGVNVLVKGATHGTITDLDGNFVLEADAGSTLVVSYIGYLTQELRPSESMVITLREDIQSLDEVVVTGYGSQAKKDITGSVAVVDTKELLASSGSSATQQLQGKAAGVYIGQTGAPGSPTMVRIRGVNTVNDNGPLYVIDGVSTRNQDLSTLNPNDIESMQVLKDASSAAIYGAQAANGVILITTKKGSRGGQPRLTYDGYVGVQKTGKSYDMLNSMDRLNLEWDAKKNQLALTGAGGYPTHVQFGTGETPTIPNYMTQAGANGSQTIDISDYSYPDNTYAAFSDTDWWDEIDRPAMMHSHNVSLSGGSDKGQYNLSANYFKQDGTVIDTYYQRYQVRANTSFNVRDWLRVGENITYAYTKDNGLNSTSDEASPYSWTYRASPYVPVYDVAGNFAGSKFAGTGNFQNPVAVQKRSKDNKYYHNRIFGNLWAEVDLFKDLTFRTNFGLDYTNYNYIYMSKNNPEFSETTGQNYLEEYSEYNYRWVWSNTLTYSKIFNDVHNLTVLLGTEAIKDGLGRSLSGRRYNYLYEDNVDTWTLDLGENDNQRLTNSSYNGEFALFGMFARVDYSYDNKYLLTGIVRRDGASRFSESNRYGVFPSISVGWRLSSEDFMEKHRDWLDDLKLRVGYGQTGNSEVPRASNFATEFITDTSYSNYDFSGANSSATTGYILDKLGNEDTKWETTQMVNVGLDATLQGGKFAFDVEWYWKKTTDMLIEAQYSSLAGADIDKPYINYGDIKNTGFDFNFNYRDRKGDWAWDLGLNLSRYKNVVLRISESDDASIWGSGTRLSTYVTRTTKGHAISEFYGYVVDGFYESVDEVLALTPLGQTVTDEETAATWVGKFKFADVNGDGQLTEDDRTFIGSPHPDLIAGLNAAVTWKNWDFSMFWYSTIGNDMFNNTKYFTDFWLFEGNKSTRMRDLSWTPGADNSNAILPILDYGDTYSGTYTSSYYVEDASFLRLKNVVLGYTFPKTMLSKAGIQNLRLYVQAENVLTITGYSGLDPEYTNVDPSSTSGGDLRRGIDMGGWPTTMRFLFGVNFEF